MKKKMFTKFSGMLAKVLAYPSHLWEVKVESVFSFFIYGASANEIKTANFTPFTRSFTPCPRSRDALRNFSTLILNMFRAQRTSFSFYTRSRYQQRFNETLLQFLHNTITDGKQRVKLSMCNEGIKRQRARRLRQKLKQPWRHHRILNVKRRFSESKYNFLATN